MFTITILDQSIPRKLIDTRKVEQFDHDSIKAIFEEFSNPNDIVIDIQEKNNLGVNRIIEQYNWDRFLRSFEGIVEYLADLELGSGLDKEEILVNIRANSYETFITSKEYGHIKPEEIKQYGLIKIIDAVYNRIKEEKINV